MRARTGKIARLPSEVRAELNRRLLDGESGSRILAWLNALPEVSAVLAADFNQAEINPENLSHWRRGGYAEWLDDQKAIRRTKSLAEFAARMASAADGNLSAGAAAIAAGRIYEAMEHAADEDMGTLIESIGSLRAGDQQARKLTLQEQRLDQYQQRLNLDRQKFQRDTCELFLKWHANEKAKTIADDTGISTDEKTDRLGKLIFGEDW